MDIKNKIINELIDLDLPLNGITFEYWVDLLLDEYNNEFKHPNIEFRFEYLMKKYNSSKSAVEIALRRGRNAMTKRIRKKYKIKTKITNETIILLFKFNIF